MVVIVDESVFTTFGRLVPFSECFFDMVLRLYVVELLGSHISVGMESVSIDVVDEIEVRRNSGSMIAGSFPSRISCSFRWRGVLNNVSEVNRVLFCAFESGVLEMGD